MTILHARVPLLDSTVSDRNVLDGTSLDSTYSVHLEGSTITAVEPSTEEADLYLGPTLFDIQVNGYGGRTCRIPSPEKRDALAWITRILRQRGVGWWIPTITTASPQALQMAFAQCARVLDEDEDTAASIPGLHLEGPYISPVDGPRGAHSLEHVRLPDWDEFCRLQEVSGNRICLVTLAPEVEGAVPFIEKCVASGVVVAMGHTDLDRDSLAAAVQAGASLSTHLGNGAHDQIQRHNNYLWYQLACREIYASFISDGQHLPQECLYSMLHAKGLERSIVTSDAVLLGGMKPGVYKVRDREIEMLPSGRIIIPGSANLAGSASHLLECTEIAIAWAGLSHAQGWRLSSENPARLLGLDQRLGVGVGREASLTLYRYEEEGPRIRVEQTWVAGRKVYDAATDAPVQMPDQPLDAESPL
jgi:N-acetylglucosamine-6-phosphate deacetylase